MHIDLVQVTTSDGVRLHGALETPAQRSSPAQATSLVDAWICIHGTGSNFYAASTLAGLTTQLLETGAVLRVNTRGHDIICTGPSAGGRVWQGAAFERVDESPLDLSAWFEFLKARGFNRIGLLGHSLGAVKAIYTLASQVPPAVSALVAISPPRLSHSHFLQSARGDEFFAAYAAAQEKVSSGRGDEVTLVRLPIVYFASAAAYVDRYGPSERYNILTLLDRVTCPVLVTYGSTEVQRDVAFQGMPEAVGRLATPENGLQVAVIAGADHIYTGCHDALAARILSWVRRLERRET